MNDAHTPKLLSEADAAADLAGVSRPVSEQPIEGPALPLLARLYSQGRYTRASVDINHQGQPLTSLSNAAEWRQKALLRWQLIQELVSERDALAGRVAELEAEVLDQCRLNGMGAERESALMGRVRELEGWRDAVWLAHEHMKLHLPHYTPNHNVFDTLESLLAAAPTEAKPAQDAVECDACHGAGRTGDQYFDSEKTCWKCEGAGAVVRAAISAKEQP